jgi:hypothetical protein
VQKAKIELSQLVETTLPLTCHCRTPDVESALAFPNVVAGPQYVLLLAVLARETLTHLVQRSTGEAPLRHGPIRIRSEVAGKVSAPPPLPLPLLACTPTTKLSVEKVVTDSVVFPTVLLNRIYPATAGASGGVSGANKLSTEEMRNCINASASRLLNHYVEMQGSDMARMISQAMDASATGDVTGATWARFLLVRLDSLVREVNNAFGESHRWDLSASDDSVRQTD